MTAELTPRPGGWLRRPLWSALLAGVLLLIAAVLPLAQRTWAIGILDSYRTDKQFTVIYRESSPAWTSGWFLNDYWLQRAFRRIDLASLRCTPNSDPVEQDWQRIVWAARQLNCDCSIRLDLERSASTDLRWLPQFSRLTELRLKTPLLSLENSRDLGRCTSLTSLDIDTPSLTAENLRELDQLFSLTEFGLHRCSIEPQLVGLMPNAERLEDLAFIECRLQGPELATLPPMPHLRNLDLGRNPLQSVELSTLTRFAALEELGLENTQIPTDALTPLPRFPKLRSLSLWGTKLHDPALELLARCPNLKSAVLYKGSFAQEALQTFRKGRPDIKLDESTGSFNLMNFD